MFSLSHLLIGMNTVLYIYTSWTQSPYHSFLRNQFRNCSSIIGKCKQQQQQHTTTIPPPKKQQQKTTKETQQQQ